MPATFDPYLAMRLRWPTHWRQTIYKIEQKFDMEKGQHVILVAPKNPDYMLDYFQLPASQLCKPYLPHIEFDHPEQLDRWARVVARLDE